MMGYKLNGTRMDRRNGKLFSRMENLLSTLCGIKTEMLQITG